MRHPLACCALAALAASCVKRVAPSVGDDRTTMSGVPLTFGADSELPEGTRVTWDFGDGTPPAEGPRADHAFPRAGAFTVTETVRDKDGQTRTSTARITVLRRLVPMAIPADVRAALGWSMTPVIWSPIYRIPLLIFASRMHVGPKVNLHATLVDFVSRGGCSVLVVYLFLQGAFTVWCIVLASFTVAEAQRFSTQKGFVTVLATLALPVLVVAAAVLAFRS